MSTGIFYKTSHAVDGTYTNKNTDNICNRITGEMVFKRDIFYVAHGNKFFAAYIQKKKVPNFGLLTESCFCLVYVAANTGRLLLENYL